MCNSFLSTLLVCLLIGCSGAHTSQLDLDHIRYYQQITDKPYDDVLAELKIAITEQNFRITSHSRVGKVIRERGNVDFPDYDTIQFCNLTHAKTLLEISAHSIRHMPCSVVVYTENDQVIVKTKLLPTDSQDPELNDFSQHINSMLRGIVDFAVEY